MKLRYATALTWLITSSTALAQEAPPFADPFTPPPMQGAPLPSGNAAQDESFDFFQNGFNPADDSIFSIPSPNQANTQVTVGEAQPVASTEEETTPKKTNATKPGRLRVVRFDYRNQYLPQRTYAYEYNRHNQHLPVRRTPEGYDAELFKAAARNDLRAVRALVEHAGRSVKTYNAQGLSLTDIAAAHQAHTVLRYVLAKGAPATTNPTIQLTRMDAAALSAARTPYFPQ